MGNRILLSTTSSQYPHHEPNPIHINHQHFLDQLVFHFLFHLCRLYHLDGLVRFCSLSLLKHPSFSTPPHIYPIQPNAYITKSFSMSQKFGWTWRKTPSATLSRALPLDIHIDVPADEHLIFYLSWNENWSVCRPHKNTERFLKPRIFTIPIFMQFCYLLHQYRNSRAFKMLLPPPPSISAVNHSSSSTLQFLISDLYTHSLHPA